MRDRYKVMFYLVLYLLPLLIAVPYSLLINDKPVAINDDLRDLAARQGVPVENLMVMRPTMALGLYAECVWIVAMGLATFSFDSTEKMAKRKKSWKV